MASSSSPRQKNAFFGTEAPNTRRKSGKFPRVFDVFINHRGLDVNKTVAAELSNSLEEQNILVFRNQEEEELGDSFPLSIRNAIRSASVHVAIFSKRYAELDRCLFELVLMLQSNAMIIPVFYQVQPWELRHIEKGVYAKAFTEHQRRHGYKSSKEWKEALQQISFTAGYELRDSDSGDCKAIVSAVETEIQRRRRIHVAKYTVGLPEVVKDLKTWCLKEIFQDFEIQRGMKPAVKEKANVVGIFGLGGVGKTTLSKELFNQKRFNYKRRSFLCDVREEHASDRLLSLQRQLLNDIFCESSDSFQSSKEGADYLRDCWERNNSFSFLIVLDDVDHVDQIEALLPIDVLNKHGNNNHLIIITTRDVRVLVSVGIDVGYRLKGLNREDGKELFCMHAFNQPYIPSCSNFMTLVDCFVDVCGGLPLSLIVLGRHVSGRSVVEWEEELEKVRKVLPGDVKRSLRVSFDALDNEEKQIFMDIACFFVGKSVNKAMSIWKGSGLRAKRALGTLKNKCLVEEEVKYPDWVDGLVYGMHDHVRDLGREMADELKHPPRVWHPQVLKSLETKRFQTILAQSKGRCFHSIVDKCIPSTLTYFLKEPDDASDAASLLWLQLEHKTLRQNHLNPYINSRLFLSIPLQNLQCLIIRNVCFGELWQSDVEVPSNLKELDITGCRNFRRLSATPDHCKLVQLQICECQQLEDLRLAYMTCLEKVTIKSCDSLKCVSSISNLAKLVAFEISGCPMLEGVEILSCEKLRIITLPIIFQRLVGASNHTNLTWLVVKQCPALEDLTLDRWSCLREMEIDSCEKLQNISLPTTLNNLRVLNCRDLRRVAGASNLTKLTQLFIKECPALEEFPCFARETCSERIVIESCEKLQKITLPTTLTELGIKRCRGLERVGESGELTDLRRLTLEQCPALQLEHKTFRQDHLNPDINSRLFLSIPLQNLQCLIIRNVCFRELWQSDVEVPLNLKELEITGCRNFRRLSATPDHCKLVQLQIRECQQLEDLSLAYMACLEKVTIEYCDSLKCVSSISNLAKLVAFEISGCRMLEGVEILSCEKLWIITLPIIFQRVVGASNHTNLTWLVVKQCPALEDLTLDRWSCLREMEIDSCEKLQNISLPTTLNNLRVLNCRDLRRVAGASNLTKLTQLFIKECPALEEFPCFARETCSERIVIESCEKLQKITLPTTLTELGIKRCRGLERVGESGELTDLRRLTLEQCPALQLEHKTFRQDHLNPDINSRLFLSIPLQNLQCLIIRNVCFRELWQSDVEVPLNLKELEITGCRNFRRLSATPDHCKLVQLQIRECQQLEDLSLAYMACLEKVTIEYCDSLKCVSSISNLAKLVAFEISGCRMLEGVEILSCEKLWIITLPIIFQRVVGASNHTNLTWLVVKQCPALEDLTLDRWSCLREMEIDSCEKLQNISLPTTLNNLRVLNCRDLRRVAGASNLTKLTQLFIKECPALEEFPCFARETCSERIVIDSCEKLQKITLPTSLIELSIKRCRGLQRVAVSGELTDLRWLTLKQCPELMEFPSLARLECLEPIDIHSCDKLLPKIAPQNFGCLYWINVAIKKCFDKLKGMLLR